MASKIELGLPPKPFLYTLDQIADLLQIDMPALRVTHLYFDNVSPGVRGPHRILARNIALPEEKPEWRVAEEELRRWLKVKGFRVYDRSQLRI